jgi:succinate dehydrogenase / fumarate reductase, cytochrome b subunit
VTSLFAVLRSSLGKKYVMGLTGLFLCSFLVIHLAGNLLLYVGEGAYNDYAHKVHANPALIYTAELILYTGIGVHLLLAYTTWKENTDARGPVGYSQKRTKIYNRILGIQAESMMFFTGAVVLVFMAIHIYDFKSRDESTAPFAWAVGVLGDMSRKVLYVVGSLFLGVHVSHGFRSAFQSLGINHPKYNKLIDRTSIVFALVVAIGFASFPIWFSSPATAVEAVPDESKTEMGLHPGSVPRKRVEPESPAEWPKPRIRLLSFSGRNEPT